jgi:sulfatase modifying factor 1
MPEKKHIEESLLPDLSFRMIFVEGGEFLMGSPDDDPDAFSYEKPRHLVKVPSFYLGEFPLTQDIWEAVMGDNPSRFKDPRQPVEMLSWEEAQQFIQKINKMAKGGSYRLPAEAEWEYAARGGKYSEGYNYAGSDKLKEVGWYDENSGNKTQKVGLLRENELGLFDMSGNVWEWCEDQWHDNYKGAPDDGSAWLGLEKWALRVLRGGSWFYGAGGCRAAYRRRSGPAIRLNSAGFRLACSPQSVG